MTSNFSLHHATSSDIPQVTDVYYRAIPTAGTLVPDTPACREWLNTSFRASLDSETPHNGATLLVVKDMFKPDKPVVAFARYYKFNSSWSEDWRNRYSSSLPIGVHKEEFVDAFLMPMVRQHRAILQPRPHYYLECLATHPSYHRMGLGSMLLKVGCKTADKDGLESYLDTSPIGRPLYERWGYRLQEVGAEREGTEWYDPAPMVRVAGKDVSCSV